MSLHHRREGREGHGDCAKEQGDAPPREGGTLSLPARGDAPQEEGVWDIHIPQRNQNEPTMPAHRYTATRSLGKKPLAVGCDLAGRCRRDELVAEL